MDNCIIVSRYNEDLSWLKSFRDFKIFIYNKGQKYDINITKDLYTLPNVGRESHTWLYHIVNNYNNLSKVNIFLQGRIDDLGCMAYQNPNNYLLDIERSGFCASRYGLLGPFHWKYNVGIENDIRYKEDWENGKITKSSIGFRKFAKNLFPEIPIFVATSYGGCFAVKKNKIMQHNKKFYINLLNILEKSRNPIEGHFMERLWCYIFSKNNLLNHSIKDMIQTKFENLNKIFFT